MAKVINKGIKFIKTKFFKTGLEQETNKVIVKGELKIKELSNVSRKIASEGIVLLKNENNILPLDINENVCFFGRCQIDYFCVGYGSGGDVCPPYKKSLIDGLNDLKVKYDKRLSDIYKKWTSKKSNIPDEGYWGNWPMSFPEMELNDKEVKNASKRSNKAVIVIGRAAGEDRENKLIEGSYYLTSKEKKLLDKVTHYFDNVILVMDCGNMIDLSFTLEYKDKIKAILYAWQGGMESGTALADILYGKETPSGKLTMTIAKNYSDYPSSKYFGNKDYNNYVEDIYVGYRYFDTFCQDKVLYPFGYGLSYTKFDRKINCEIDDTIFKVNIDVNNVGLIKGKEVIQAYLYLPNGKLGNPLKVLCGFEKTNELKPLSKENVSLIIDIKDFASYDDNISCFILQNGEYKLFIDNEYVSSIKVENEIVVSKHNDALRPNQKDLFKRMVNKNGCIDYEDVIVKTKDLKKEILDNLPITYENKIDEFITFDDVLNGKYTVYDLVSQLTFEELNDICHGEGKMNSSLGPSNNAGAFGGVTESLKKRKIPFIITTDGPSGIRLHTVSALLPCGTCLASSFNKKGVEELYDLVGKEMRLSKTNMLLAPGMNIHRDPLCGRNFEYFSEDPYLTGMIGTSVVLGLQKNGVSACPKHFACNNQEYNRHQNDSRVSERALREIYLKGFEIVVKNAKPKCIMTSYNKINGVWSNYNYELNTIILRKEWGYNGLVITDWWMQPDISKEFENIKNDSYRIRAQVDVLMPGEFGEEMTLVSSLKDENGISLGEAQRTAINVLNFIINLIDEKKNSDF